MKNFKLLHQGDSDADLVTNRNRFSYKIAQLFLPDSNVRIVWDVFVFLVIWYNSVITPIRIFIMSGHDSTPQALVSLDVGFDFVFVADTILRFYRPYVDGNTGQIVIDPQLIRSKYMGSVSFYINSIACIPIIKLPISQVLSVNQQTSLLTYFNVLRMIRVLHLPEQFQELKRFKERKGPVNEPVFRMHVILFFMLLFMCQCGCLYFGLSTLLVVDDICPAPDNFVDDVLGEELWVAQDTVITNVMDTRVCKVEPTIHCEECPQTIFFIRTLYFLMQTIFTIGYGDSVVPSKSSVEMALGCVFMIFGVFAYALTIANMTSVLANLDVVNMQFRHEMDTISHWMAFRSMPTQLKQQISTFFSYLSRSQHGVLDEKLLGELPPRLKIELAESYIPLLTKVPFFNERRSDTLLSLVASALKRRVYTPGSLIIHQADMQRELVIIKSGKADILLQGVPDAVGSLLPGDFIGDYQLLFGTVNQVTVRTVDFTEALVLTFAEFKQVMNHPHNDEFAFAKLGGTFRQSNDDGCIETIYETKESMKKILATANTILSGKTRSKLKDMMAEHEVVTKEFRILPNSKVHLYWDVFSIASILYYSIDVPIRIASSYRASTLASTYDYGFIVSYCIDAMFIVDMILRASVYAYSCYEHGRTIIVTNKSQIRQKYLSSGKFKVDLFAIVPFDLIAAGTSSYHSLFRLSKLVRVSQIPHGVSNLQTHLDACLNIKTTETQRSILLMFLYSVLLIVWSSAGWNALRPGESGVISVYWAITTLSTVGYGDVTPEDFVETTYALVVGAVGAVFTAAVVANVTSFFHDAELSEHNYEHKMNCIKRFVERHKIPHDSAQRVIEYFDYIDQEQDGLNESVILRESIPDHLASNVLVHITQPMVDACDFFADCESGLIRKIMTSLEQVFFGAQYMVLTSHVPSNNMYFIKKGMVHLMKEDDKDKSVKIIRKLDANDSFAEGCLVEYWEKNPFLAQTASECELWALKRSVFQQILVQFPRSRALLKRSNTKQNDEQHRRRASVHEALKAAERVKRGATRYIHPHSLFIQGWFGVILGVTLYSMIVLPFRVAFMENYEISPAWVFFDYCGDFIFLVDFLFRANFEAFFDENNNLVVDHKAIWQRFVNSGKVKWHVLSMMPLEVLSLAFPTLCPLWRLQTWSLFRLNKLLRAIEMPSLIGSVESSLVKVGAKVPKNPLKVVKLLLVILLLAHLNSCVFFTIANLNQHANSGDLNAQHNWANAEGLLGKSPTCPGEAVSLEMVSQQYTAGLYWAMATITTVGYGDITADLNSLQEILYSTLILIVGMSVYTLVIASLEDIVSQLDVTSSLHKMKTDKVNSYAQIQCLPESLKAKLFAYNDQLWHSHLGVKGEKLLKYISPSLKSELIQDMALPYLESAFFLKDCNADFVHYIMQCLELEIYLPDDYLFREGERGDALHFLVNGSVDLLTSQGVKFKTVSNCTLGETSFFLFEPQICSAKADVSCEVFQLRTVTFMNGLDDYQLSSHFRKYLAAHHSSLQEAKASILNTITNLSSSKMVRFLDANNDVVNVPKGVILPDSNFRVAWDIALLVGLLYLIMSIPVQISFASIGIVNFIVDLVVDAFFLMDVYCRLRKFAVVKNGFLVTRPKDFGKLYRTTGLYLHLVCVFPASILAFALGVRNQYYGICRLFQFLRVFSFVKYLEGVTEIVSTKTRFTVTTATLRVTQIFMIILILTHWFSCSFHFIGVQGAEFDDTWINVDEMQHESLGRRYLRSFYWSLYSITTIGYGSVPVVSIHERIFAMLVMAVGAVICDAGLTAVLASILQNKDHQAGTNNRRIACTKLFMSTNDVDESLQSRILDFFAYLDDEMRNIDETDILSDLSSSLRSEVLSHFSYDSLRDCAYFDDISDGAIHSLIKNLEPYLAVTGEKLSVIGERCHALYVFQKGSVRTKDATGSVANLAEGAIIGHLATQATSHKEGLPTHSLQINLLSANLSKSKNGNPYVIVKNGRYRCRSLIKSTRNWMETIDMKVKVESAEMGHKTELIVKEWRKRQNHVVVGYGKIIVTESSLGGVMVCPIHDDRGRNVGTIELRAKLCRLSTSDSLTSHEMTTTALNFSHLYRLPVSVDKELRKYLDLSRRSNFVERVPVEGKIGLDSASDCDWDLPIILNEKG
jgi:CRP-like cAMP-binding protein